GMEGPGGYQFVGRTVQMWNRYRQTADFTDGRKWLLRFFDQIRFYPVSTEELAQTRKDFIQGTFNLEIEETTLRLRDYNRFLNESADDISRFKQRQQAAFDAERERWEQSGQAQVDSALPDEVSSSDAPFEVPHGCIAIASPVTGSVWSIAVRPGDRVQIGDDLVIVEAMKMEIAIESDETGIVKEVLCAQGDPVKAGQAMVILEIEEY
ncbi:MAG: biotin/lipoyl-binding protein, partial [Thiogranum sp.]|nr:biotin/lipoyl-binding protein [Thiogranum sp.]